MIKGYFSVLKPNGLSFLSCCDWTQLVCFREKKSIKRDTMKSKAFRQVDSGTLQHRRDFELLEVGHSVVSDVPYSESLRSRVLIWSIYKNEVH
jgi:hypothetical protein